MSAVRLAGAASAYLRDHAADPVDWHPWGEEAIRLARDEARPIFLSVGTASCYWCRVTGRDSFAEPALADFMNRRFVNVLVDRFERPDVDELARAATLVYAHQSGWPTTVFLTPRLEPYFAGTYFPRADRLGGPGLVTVLHSMAEAWVHQRDDVHAQGAELATALRDFLDGRTASAGVPGEALAETALASLRERFDGEHGGFGTGAKFPQPAALHLLADLADDDPGAAGLLDRTLEAIARGGVRDHLRGGFHRHAVDRAWRVPQLEKLLVDNAHLLELLARAAARRGDPFLATAARETAAFLDRDLGLASGAFAVALDLAPDLDAEPTHVWTREGFEAALGTADAAFFAGFYGADGPPFFEERYYALHRPRSSEEEAKRRRTTVERLEAELEPLRDKLRRDRATRERARRDDLVTADANGAAVAALVSAGVALGEADWVRRAEAAAEALLATLRPAGGPLRHSDYEGAPGPAAFLADYAETIRGLTALAGATGARRWLAVAGELALEAGKRLGLPDGGWASFAPDPSLPYRWRDVFDGAGPAALPQMALALLDLAELGGEPRWRQVAAAALRSAGESATARPESARTYARAARRLATASSSRNA